MWLISLIREPYPYRTLREEWKIATVISIFVFAFLTFFQPFGLAGALVYLIGTTSIYGLITFCSMMLVHILFRKLMPSFFTEKNWTFGKELISSLFMFSIIGSFNLIYTNHRFGLSLTLGNFFWFQLITFAVGFFPVLFFMLINYTRLLKENTTNAQQLSASFTSKYAQDRAINGANWTIKSELKSDDLTLNLNDFLFAEAADNYIAVSFLINGVLQKKLVRTTLAKLEADIESDVFLIRCHRTFIVNLNYVESFKGNAQGLQLKLFGTESEIPVSRKMVTVIKNHFS